MADVCAGAALWKLTFCLRGSCFGAFGGVWDDPSTATFFFLTCWPVPDSLIIFRRFSVLNNYFNKLNIRVSFNVLFLSYVISELPDFPARLVSD